LTPQSVNIIVSTGRPRIILQNNLMTSVCREIKRLFYIFDRADIAFQSSSRDPCTTSNCKRFITAVNRSRTDRHYRSHRCNLIKYFTIILSPRDVGNHDDCLEIFSAVSHDPCQFTDSIRIERILYAARRLCRGFRP